MIVCGCVIIIVADLLCNYFNNVINYNTVIITVVQLNIQYGFEMNHIEYSKF